MSDRKIRGSMHVVAIGDQEGDGDPLNVISTKLGTVVTEYNVPLILANTQYARTLPAGCCAFSFRCRTSSAIRYAWQTGRVATSTSPYQTLTAGSEYSKENINLGATRTIYFAHATGGVMVEIEAWS